MRLPTLPSNIDTLVIPELFEALRPSDAPQWVADDTHPLIAAIAAHLATVEQHLANEAGRPSCEIQVHLDDRRFPGARPDEGYNDNRRTWHNDQLWRNNIGYRNGTPGLALAGNAAHEGEHANQTMGCGYTENQRIMCALATRFYPGESQNLIYRNNYTEVYARIAEGKFYLAVVDHLKRTRPDVLRNPRIQGLVRDMPKHVSADVSLQTMKDTNRDYIAALSNPLTKVVSLHKVFPDVHPRLLKSAARSFLKKHGDALCAQAISDIEEVKNALENAYQEIQKMTQEYNERIEQEKAQALQEQLDKTIEKYHIPVIQELPWPTPDRQMYLNTPEDIIAACAPEPDKYNLCIMYTANGLSAWYDTSPRQRDYYPQHVAKDIKVEVIITEQEDPELSGKTQDDLEWDEDVK